MPWISLVLLSAAALLVSFHLATYFSRAKKHPYHLVIPITFILTTSYIIYISVGKRHCHSGLFCGAVDQATFITPSGVKVPLNIFNEGREEEWASTALNPKAVDPQTACHGYTISNVKESKYGLTADLDLQGCGCNVYGHDVWELSLVVEHQAKDRLRVEILPRYVSAENETWYILPEELIPKPKVDDGYNGKDRDFEFILAEGNEFAFSVKRKSTGETLFSTVDSHLVFEDQFFELKTRMPEDYNIYGLGEVMHGFKLGNNLTSK